MGETPDQLKARIQSTRADMTATVDAMAYRANPRNAARRQAGRLGQRIGAVRDAVMGRVEDLTSSASDTASGAVSTVGGAMSGASDQLRHGPGAVPRQAQGNPVAAGMIAFGAGLLAASIIPSSEAERRAAASVGGQAEPLVEQARQAAQDMGDHLKSSAQEAVEQVKGTASDATQEVRDQASEAAGRVTDTTKSAAQDVGATAQEQRQSRF